MNYPLQVNSNQNISVQHLQQKIDLLQRENRDLLFREENQKKINAQLVQTIQQIEMRNGENQQQLATIIREVKNYQDSQQLQEQHKQEYRMMQSQYQNTISCLQLDLDEAKQQKEGILKAMKQVQYEFDQQNQIVKDQFDEIKNLREQIEIQKQQLIQDHDQSLIKQQKEFQDKINEFQQQIVEEKNRVSKTIVNQSSIMNEQIKFSSDSEQSQIQKLTQQFNKEKGILQSQIEEQNEINEEIKEKLKKEIETIKRHREEAYEKVRIMQKEKKIFKNQIVDQNLLFDKILVLEKEKSRLKELTEDNQKLQDTINEVNGMYQHLKNQTVQMQENYKPNDSIKKLTDQYNEVKVKYQDQKNQNEKQIKEIQFLKEDFDKKMQTVVNEMLNKEEKVQKLQKKLKSQQQYNLIYSSSKNNLEQGSINMTQIQNYQTEANQTMSSSKPSKRYSTHNNANQNNMSQLNSSLNQSFIGGKQILQNKYINIKSPSPNKYAQGQFTYRKRTSTQQITSDQVSHSLQQPILTQIEMNQSQSYSNNKLQSLIPNLKQESLSQSNNGTENCKSQRKKQNSIRQSYQQIDLYLPENCETQKSQENKQSSILTQDMTQAIQLIIKEDPSYEQKLISQYHTIEQLNEIMQQIRSQKKQQQILQHCQSDDKVIQKLIPETTTNRNKQQQNTASKNKNQRSKSPILRSDRSYSKFKNTSKLVSQNLNSSQTSSVQKLKTDTNECNTRKSKVIKSKKFENKENANNLTSITIQNNPISNYSIDVSYSKNLNCTYADNRFLQNSSNNCFDNINNSQQNVLNEIRNCNTVSVQNYIQEQVNSNKKNDLIQVRNSIQNEMKNQNRILCDLDQNNYNLNNSNNNNNNNILEGLKEEKNKQGALKTQIAGQQEMGQGISIEDLNESFGPSQINKNDTSSCINLATNQDNQTYRNNGQENQPQSLSNIHIKAKSTSNFQQLIKNKNQLQQKVDQKNNNVNLQQQNYNSCAASNYSQSGSINSSLKSTGNNFFSLLSKKQSMQINSTYNKNQQNNLVRREQPSISVQIRDSKNKSPLKPFK